MGVSEQRVYPAMLREALCLFHGSEALALDVGSVIPAAFETWKCSCHSQWKDQRFGLYNAPESDDDAIMFAGTVKE